MSKKAVISNLYKSIAILFIIVLTLILTYSTTSLYPNCGECLLDNLKTEKAYIESQLKYEEDKIFLDDDEYFVTYSVEKAFLVGVSNKLNQRINIQMDIKEAYSDEKADVIKSGIFEFDDKPFILEPKVIRIIPIKYHNDGFVGTAEFTIYARNLNFPYGDPNHNYAANNFILNVK